MDLNNLLQPNNAPVTQPRSDPAFTFETHNEVQGRRIRSSMVNLDHFIQHPATGTVSGGPFGDGTSFNITSIIAYNPPYTEKPIFGIPMLSIYQGTAAVGTLQIYPKFGSGIANNTYHIHSGFNYAQWDGKNLPFAVNIENNTGAPQNAYAVVQWKFVEYNQGAAA